MITGEPIRPQNLMWSFYRMSHFHIRLHIFNRGGSTSYTKLCVGMFFPRNLIAFSKDASDPFIRLYLLPDKSRTGRRKTATVKKSLNPVYDQTWVSHIRTMWRISLLLPVCFGGIESARDLCRANAFVCVLADLNSACQSWSSTGELWTSL